VVYIIKLFNSTNKTYSLNGDIVIIPTKTKVYKEENEETKE
jgi:hypothetical protein